MAKTLVVKEDDPGVAVTLEHVREGTPGRAQGWYGSCTECGPDWRMHRWAEGPALDAAHHHIDVIHGEKK